MNLDRLKSLIAREEGLRLKPYPDHLGNLTIGYGTLIEPGKGQITQRGAEFLMTEALLECAQDLAVFPFWHHASDPRKEVLLSMRYQLGRQGFRGFQKMIAAANTGKWDEAAREALNSRWATQTPERAQRVAKTLRTGEPHD